MSGSNVLKLRLALMGRPVRNYTFDKPVISVGRDPDSDVFVDNPGVSRDHFRLERTEHGAYRVVDLGSANGTMLNDEKVNVAVVRNNDVVRFGKYTLWVGYDQDRRSGDDLPARAATDTERHTMVLSRAELDHVISVSKEKEQNPDDPPAAPVVAAPVVRAAPAPMAAVLIAFMCGVVLGAGVVWLLTQR